MFTVTGESVHTMAITKRIFSLGGGNSSIHATDEPFNEKCAPVTFPL